MYYGCLEKKYAPRATPDEPMYGSGFLRAGGWAAVKAIHAVRDRMKGDDAILGDGEIYAVCIG